MKTMGKMGKMKEGRIWPPTHHSFSFSFSCRFGGNSIKHTKLENEETDMTEMHNLDNEDN